MAKWLRCTAVIVLLALMFGAGYVAGVAHAVRVQCARERAAAQARRDMGIPYPSTICDNCYRDWPDWWCFLGGCPLP